MSLFRIKFFDFVNKPDNVKHLEKKSLEFVSKLNNQQKVLAMLYKKLRYLNDICVLNINNYTPQINVIKSAHHSVVKYIGVLNNKHLVVSSQYVDILDEMFKCITEMVQLKKALTQLQYGRKAIEIKYEIINNASYQNLLVRMLMLFQRFKKLFYQHTTSTQMLSMYIQNALDLEKKLMNIYKTNPYELTTFANNTMFLKQISKQLPFAQRLLEEFGAIDTGIERDNKELLKLQFEYRKEQDMLPMYVINDPDFGTFEDMIHKRYTLGKAIERQMMILQRELNDMNRRDNIKYDQKLFIRTDPKLMKLKNEKYKVEKEIVNVKNDLDIVVDELEVCLKKNENDINACVKFVGAKRSKIKKPKNIADLQVKLMKYKDTISDEANLIRSALQKLYERQRKLATDTEFKSALSQIPPLSQIARNLQTNINVSEFMADKTHKTIVDQINVVGELSDLRGGAKHATENDETLKGGDIVVVEKMNRLNVKKMMYQQLKERYMESYKKAYRDHIAYIEHQLANGVNKTPEQILKDAFKGEIESIVRDEFDNCCSMNLADITNASQEKLFVMKGGADNLPGTLKVVLHDKLLKNTDPKVLHDLKGKMSAIFGPSKNQYNVISEIVNNIAADKKYELQYRYHAEPRRLEAEYMKIDTCVVNVKEKLYKYIDMYPNYDSLCYVGNIYKVNLYTDELCQQIDLLVSVFNTYYTQAKGIKLAQEAVVEFIKTEQCAIAAKAKKCDQTHKDIEARGINAIINEINRKYMEKTNTNLKLNLEDDAKVVDPGWYIGQQTKNIVVDYINNLNKNDPILRNNIADARDQLLDAVYQLKRAYGELKRMYADGLVPKIREHKRLESKMNLLNMLVDNVTFDKAGDQYRKLNNQKLRTTSLLNNRSIKYDGIKAQLSAVDKYLVSIRNIITSSTQTFSEKYIEYKNNFTLGCDKLAAISALSVYLGMLCDNEVNKYEGKSFNEEMLKYAFSSDIDLQTDFMSEQYNRMLAYNSEMKEIQNKLTELRNKCLDNTGSRCYNKFDIAALNMGKLSENINNLYANMLLQKNIDKISSLDNSEGASNIMRLHHNMIMLRTDKLNEGSILTNKFNNMLEQHNYRGLCRHQLIKVNDELCAHLNKGFSQLFRDTLVLSNMYNSISYVCYGLNVGNMNVIDLYNEKYKNFIDSLLDINFIFGDNSGNDLININEVLTTFPPILNEIITNQDECTNSGLDFNKLSEQMKNIASKLKLNMRIELNYTTLADLIAYEFI